MVFLSALRRADSAMHGGFTKAQALLDGPAYSTAPVSALAGLPPEVTWYLVGGSVLLVTFRVGSAAIDFVRKIRGRS